ncbi:MAG: hypothetical protein HZC41_06820 [Chloroflexi bacterium]|nr:hypothetical protein [Chloroflexota bacterium]
MRGDTAETRAIKLVDLPLVKRLSENGVVLDCELCFTQNAGSTRQGGSIFMLLLPYRGVHTLITRAGKQQVVGQFRLKPDGNCAHIAYIAPVPEDESDDDTAWLHILDAMAVEAGKRGAHLLAAEVDEHLPLFKTMRTASYSIYARQEIWQLPAGVGIEGDDSAELTEATDADLPGIQVLYSNIVPRLVQQIPDLPGDGHGLVYRKDERIAGYIAVAEGKSGVYLMPHLHPEVFSEAPAIIAAAVARTNRGAKLPVYVRVRRYQDWLDDALLELGFDCRARQAVMVKHIAAGVRTTSFVPLHRKLEAVPSPVKPPTSGITDT